MSNFSEVPEAYYSRLCPGNWAPHDETKLTELALLMKDSPQRREVRERTSAMPSGYVYLGQFIDHDITRDGRFLLDEAGPDAEKTPNYRTPSLDLDTLYGKRGSVLPDLDEETGELPLGETLAAKYEGSDFPAKREDLLRGPDGTAKIIDPRNDENLVVAQMQVLFTKFHNQVLKLLKAYPSLSAGPSGASPFEQARRFVTWHYQWIVLNDFLPMIARIKVLEDIQANGLRLFKRNYTPVDYPMALPIEFTVAAFRFGHSMIQESYRLHPTMIVETAVLMRMTKRGEGINSNSRALPANYVIDWDDFFIAPEAVLNRGQNIDTFITEALYALPQQNVVAFRVNRKFESLAATHLAELMLPLPELTLRRGSKMRLPGGEEFADYFRLPKLNSADIPALPEDEGFFAQPEFRGRTPLWYYLLREAAVEAASNPEPGDGPAPPMQKLGTIGSRIVTEVLLQILAADADSIRNVGASWTPPRFPFGLSAVPRSLDSMPNLIEFVRHREGEVSQTERSS
jgi:hypothetical protein